MELSEWCARASRQDCVDEGWRIFLLGVNREPAQGPEGIPGVLWTLRLAVPQNCALSPMDGSRDPHGEDHLFWTDYDGLASIASVVNEPCRSVDDIKKLRLITAVKTPYLECGRFDLAAYDKLVRCQILNKVEGIIVGGTTGEGQLMSWDDHIRLIAHSVTCFGDEICIIGNTGSNATNEAIKATEAGFDVGMHAALHINPYYGKTSRRGMLEHFDKVIGMGPSIIYNVPGRTGQDIPTEIVEQLAKGKHFAGIKECMGHDRVKHYAERNIEVWSGNDDECHDSRWIHGGRGVISVVSNLVPGLMHELLHTGRDDALNARLQPLITWLFKEPNPIGLNTALSQLQVIKPVFRLPYYPLCQAMREEFVKIVNDIGREHFIGSEEVMVLEDDDFKIVDRY
ncbi:hypothetical protein AXG93_3040s1170 [Marchantia polymorpha subsp. ruderalis]|uniref:4-hydroxy-tetrahydrodipicolinate synthase n=1 Tax=Marchantia polymorpha subsp. ruderalis TaxID=1480154 RepID=A0A176VZT2_MARPO|nr:hypothetical protein AXG93_3040s1170 [Marchantia polymorpha subsp. ruderalis]